MKENFEYRMYGFVPYNISEIQKGIQFGHAVVEYGLVNFNNENYQKWATHDKTFVILNGGTTNNGLNSGSLNLIVKKLIDEFNIHTTCFYEPDLGDQLTAVVFLLDERYWNYEKYPDFVDHTRAGLSENYYQEMEENHFSHMFFEKLYISLNDNERAEMQHIIETRKWLRSQRLA